MTANAFVFFGLLLVVASVLGLICENARFPKVTAYVITGAVFSRELLGQYLYPHGEYWGNDLGALALSFIGFQIGMSLSYQDVKKDGKVFVVGALGNVFGAAVFVIGAVSTFSYLMGESEVLKLSVALGAIAATTAPAGTIATIKQYGAKGTVTKNLLGLVILDDVLGVLLFAVLTSLFTASGWVSSFGSAGTEIAMSILSGIAIGVGFSLIIKRVQKESLLLPFLFGCLFLLIAISKSWHFSAILMSMSMGFCSRILIKKHPLVNSSLSKVEESIYMILFLLAGCHFEFSVFATVIPVMVVYIVSRSLGKYIGAYIGTGAAGASKMVKKYVGFGLIPQAGVAIGLALLLTEMPDFQDMKSTILNIIIGSTIVYEIVGPVLTKYSLVKAGEIVL